MFCQYSESVVRFSTHSVYTAATADRNALSTPSMYPWRPEEKLFTITSNHFCAAHVTSGCRNVGRQRVAQ